MFAYWLNENRQPSFDVVIPTADFFAIDLHEFHLKLFEAFRNVHGLDKKLAMIIMR